MSVATEPRYQYMPSMSDEDFDALKRSIAEHGFWTEFAVVVVEDGRILDGHHRARACADLGVECPNRVRSGMSEEEKDDYIWAVNIGRRHLTLEQKRELIRHRLVTKPQESDRSIARHVGVDRETVGRARRELEETGGIPPVLREGGRGVTEGKQVHPDDYPRCGICEKPVRRENLREINGLSGHAACLPVAGLLRRQGGNGMAVHYSSDTDLWSTPQDLFDALHAEFGFTLDVCATPENAKCAAFYTSAHDGLSQEWHGVCWMNPPYGDAIGRWVEKAYVSAANGVTVVCLVPARVDTNWWWDFCRHGQVRFLRGRLRFGGGDNSAPFPSAVVVFPAQPATVYWDRKP